MTISPNKAVFWSTFSLATIAKGTSTLATIPKKLSMITFGNSCLLLSYLCLCCSVTENMPVTYRALGTFICLHLILYSVDMWPVIHDSHFRAFNFKFNIKYIHQLSHKK